MRTVIYLFVCFWGFMAIPLAGDCIPFVTVKELLQNPQDYNRRIIVVDGWTRRSLEYFTIQSIKEPYQLEQIWLDDIDSIKTDEARWPEDKEHRSTSESVLDAEGHQEYRRLFSLKRPTHVILKGEFQTAKISEYGDGSFQHRLIVYAVISIKK